MYPCLWTISTLFTQPVCLMNACMLWWAKRRIEVTNWIDKWFVDMLDHSKHLSYYCSMCFSRHFMHHSFHLVLWEETLSTSLTSGRGWAKDSITTHAILLSSLEDSMSLIYVPQINFSTLMLFMVPFERSTCCILSPLFGNYSSYIINQHGCCSAWNHASSYTG